METKLQRLLARLPELEAELGAPDVFDDQKRYRELAREHAYVSNLKRVWDDLEAAKIQLKSNQQMLKEETDPEFVQVVEEDAAKLSAKIEILQTDLEALLVPPDPNDDCNTILEIRAGTGGDEAALFVGDIVRMYKLFADEKGWRYEELSSAPSDVGGYKEYVMVFSGPGVYRSLRYEGGTHRVQRVPDTETQGRVHTSAITVAVLLEPDEESEVKIDEKDLRIDTYRASGAGGQHVNTTDSAVRLTHIPTGIVAYCQDERSQHKNKDKAIRLLKVRIAEVEEEKRRKEVADTRSSQVGSGDRSERIRTYNFPQNRLTDHRINYTSHNLDRVMTGELEDVTRALVTHFYQQKLQH